MIYLLRKLVEQYLKSLLEQVVSLYAFSERKIPYSTSESYSSNNLN